MKTYADEVDEESITMYGTDDPYRVEKVSDPGT
jgi:hypothetical protein